MNTSNYYSPYLEDLTLEEIVGRDVDGSADEHERAYLRSEENLSEWRSALGSLNSSLDNELAARKKRLAEPENLYESNCSGAEIRRAYERDREEYEERKQQIKQLKESIQQRLEENKELRQRRHERLMAGGSHRDLLMKARSFLANDAAIAYSYIPERDELLAEIDRSLYSEEESDA